MRLVPVVPLALLISLAGCLTGGPSDDLGDDDAAAGDDDDAAGDDDDAVGDDDDAVGDDDDAVGDDDDAVGDDDDDGPTAGTWTWAVTGPPAVDTCQKLLDGGDVAVLVASVIGDTLEVEVVGAELEVSVSSAALECDWTPADESFDCTGTIAAGTTMEVGFEGAFTSSTTAAANFLADFTSEDPDEACAYVAPATWTLK